MKAQITLREKYGPAMLITDQAAADAYFKELVQNMMVRLGCNRAKAAELERANLGYYAGYYDRETRERVERLFRCAHPVFGAIAENGAPTITEALAAGKRAAEESD